MSAALDLVRRGIAVTVIEKSARPGGKMREVDVQGHHIDSGPTVLTMRWVFEQLFADAGSRLAERLQLEPCELLARHAWQQGGRLDLFCDRERSASAIAEFAGSAESDRFRAFFDRAEAVFETLNVPYMQKPRPGVVALVGSAGIRGLGKLWRLKPFRSLWQELGTCFEDPRLRSLFARYSTYCGASPLQAPATLMLIAHVEQCGVWRIVGGMQRLAQALAAEIVKHGGEIRYDCTAREVDVRGGRATGVDLDSDGWLAADAVIANVDVASIRHGALGTRVAAAMPHSDPRKRSLSAVTWSLLAESSGFELAHHNVFFPDDYPREFEQIFRDRTLPSRPAVYICAQDAADPGRTSAAAQRLFLITNAPAIGDQAPIEPSRLEELHDSVVSLLGDCGLTLKHHQEGSVQTTPADFERRFPGTGGALYGRPPHGWRSSFARPTARSRVRGLYLAGGSVHPGPGVPMVALSGRFAARAVATDLGLPE